MGEIVTSWDSYDRYKQSRRAAMKIYDRICYNLLFKACPSRFYANL